MNDVRELQLIMWCWMLWAVVVLSLVAPTPLYAHDAMPHGADPLSDVGFDQHLDEKIPDDLTLLDEQDRPVTFHSLLAGRPMILALSYFECETLCPLVRQGVVDVLRAISLIPGQDFEIVLVSIDPQESASAAITAKEASLASYGKAERAEGWHFLRGDHESIDRLAEAIGFRYAYDGEQDQYAHAAGIVLVTPQGRIARYFFGIEYAPRDLKLGLVEASQNQIGTAIDRLMLLCFHYDPAAGTYSFMILNVVRMAGLLTIVGIGGLIFFLRRKEPQREVPLGQG